MAGSVGATERQLNLLSTLLKARAPLGWPELADIEGYNDHDTPLRSRQKRFERDLKALEAAGLKVSRQSVHNRWHYELDRGACLLPPLGLSPEQRLLMYRIGMAYLQGDEAGPLRRSLSSALMKLQAGAGGDGLPAELPQTFVRRTLNRRPAESARLDVIGPALLDRRRVTFKYAGRGKGAATTRTVAPYALVARRGGWYLVGYDIERKAERTFRLSRMRGAVTLATPRAKAPEYEVPTDFDPERSFSTELFGRGENAFRDVRIAFSAEVGFIIENEFEGMYQLKTRKDGSVILHLPQAYPDELLRFIGEFPGHWQVQHPPELRKLVVQRLRGALKNSGRAR
ncbi:MAG: WYL domain-containing protein [Planctomycetes bacterium]|nr:WYL domain-containing protein [Planctomycetota bacterium]MCB9934155.1 WYL domain-containing protein [Planctomycetota bacterium]